MVGSWHSPVDTGTKPWRSIVAFTFAGSGVPVSSISLISGSRRDRAPEVKIKRRCGLFGVIAEAITYWVRRVGTPGCDSRASKLDRGKAMSV